MSANLDMIAPSAASTLAFVALVLGLVVLLVLGDVCASRRLGESPERVSRHALATALGIGGWVGLTAAVTASGVLRRALLPPPVALFFALSMLVATVAAFSPLGTRLARGLPIAVLVAVQAFRLPLELILHAWKDQGALPIQMTFEGHNFDIVTGSLAVICGVWGVYAPLPRAAVWIFNLIGSGLLLAVMSIAVLSSPLPIRQYLNEPAVLLAFYVPYSWIVPICVGGALFGHLLVFRWLWISGSAQRRA